MSHIVSHIRRFSAEYWYCLPVAFVFCCLIGLFLWRLTYFNFFVFDEVYYADAAVQIFQGKGDPNFQHPLFAKWLLSLPFYFIPPLSALSWRLMPVVFGLTGLFLLYTFARILGLVWWQSLLVVLALVASKGYFTLSRLAMLDIFLIFFVLLATFILYVYLKRHDFRRDYMRYNQTHLLGIFAVVVGLAGSCKISGFFIFLQILALYLFYFVGNVRKRIFHFLFIGMLSFYTFFSVNYVLYGFDFHLPIIRFWEQLVFHNSAMLPENVVDYTHSDVASLDGGWRGLYAFFFQNKVYLATIPIFLPYAYANHPALGGLFLGFSFVVLLSVAGTIIRLIQKVPFELPPMLRDKSLLFLYSAAFVHIVTWGFFERVSYVYYFVVAFPFILLMTFYYLSYYMERKYFWLFCVGYFGLFLYQVNYLIPF